MKRINLLPPEYGRRRVARRLTSVLVFAGIGYVAVLGILWLVRMGQLRNAEDELARTRNQADALQAQVAELREFADLEAVVDTKERTLATVMAADVHWSRILTELSMVVPGDAWLTSFAGTASPPQPAAPPAAGAPAAPAGPPVLGNVTFAAVTFDFPGVATWITRLSNDPSLQTIWVPNATRAQIGGRGVVNFSSTANLSAGAASNRFQPAEASP